MPSKRPTVLELLSISYTGTTWLNLVLGSHERCFAPGPADPAWEQIEKGRWDKTCLIHGANCPFWPAFGARYRKGGNFFVQLAEFSGKDIIVTNNLVKGAAASELDPNVLDLKRICVVRDGRAVLSSYRRRFPNQDWGSAVEWTAKAIEWAANLVARENYAAYRYEDIVQDPTQVLADVGRLLGIEYAHNAVSFWEWDHHPCAGNAGPMSMIQRHQGTRVPQFPGADYYLNRDVSALPEDERWKVEIDAAMLAAFDRRAGAANERLGYRRDF